MTILIAKFDWYDENLSHNFGSAASTLFIEGLDVME